MNLSFNLSDKLSLLNNTLYFFKKNFITIMALGVIAALGRVIQLGGFGQITSWMNIIIEVLVESARILIFLYVLGFANIKKGILRIKRIVIHNGDRKKLFGCCPSEIEGSMANSLSEHNWIFINRMGYKFFN